MGFLNSDETLLPGAVSRLVAGLERAPEALVAYGDVVRVDERDGPPRRTGPGEWGLKPMALRAGGTVIQPSSLWRRRAWELAGPFDESYHYWFEVLFFLEVAGFGSAVYVPEPLAAYRLHDRSKTVNATSVAQSEETLRVADEYFARADLPEPLRRCARTTRALLYRRAAWGFYCSGETARSRRALIRSLPLRPRMSRGTAKLLAKTLLP